MVQRRIIPDVYTEYEDGHLGVVEPSLANVEAKIGEAGGGVPGQVYTLSGPDAKRNANILFKSGDLLKAIEEAFDAGSSRIHAVRVGNPDQASITLKTLFGEDACIVKGDYGSLGNNHYTNLQSIIQSVTSGHVVLETGTPNKVVFYDDDATKLREVELATEIDNPVDVGAQEFPRSTDDGSVGFWVLGQNDDVEPAWTLWFYDETGTLDDTKTIDLETLLTSLADTGFEGIASVDPIGMGIDLTTEASLAFCSFATDYSSISLNEQIDYGVFDTSPVAVADATRVSDLRASLNGEAEVSPHLIVLDAINSKLYLLLEGASDMIEFDLAPDLGGDTPVGVAWNQETKQVVIAMSTGGDNDKLLYFDATFGDIPTLNYDDTLDATIVAPVAGLGGYIYRGTLTMTATIEDRNESPPLEYEYTTTGDFHTVTDAVVDAIAAGGMYSVDKMINPVPMVMSVEETLTGPLDPSAWRAFTGGTDGEALTNGDYVDGLEATESKTNTNWVHCVGATSSALWTLILSHCERMTEDLFAERFAILECKDFSTSYEPGTAGYLTDLQTYVDDIVSQAGNYADRNAVIFAGGAEFLDSDGNSYRRSVTSACGGTMAGLEVQQSLINKQVPNILNLVPEFSIGHIQSLIQAKVNCVRLKPGRGHIIAHSLTCAADGSDYSRVNDIRAVYYGAKAAREASQPLVGEENDKEGQGLRRLESAASRPLELMQDGGQIDDFELVAVSTPENRLLGEVYLSLGIQPRRAMEKIYTTVYLK